MAKEKGIQLKKAPNLLEIPIRKKESEKKGKKREKQLFGKKRKGSQ